MSQPRQPHLADEALGNPTEGSEHTLGQVAKCSVRAAGMGSSEGELCEIGVEWHALVNTFRHSQPKFNVTIELVDNLLPQWV